MKLTTMYMHTINGFPAYFHQGAQICYASGKVHALCVDLNQLRKEQRASISYRRKRGFNIGLVYGHCRVVLPTRQPKETR